MADGLARLYRAKLKRLDGAVRSAVKCDHVDRPVVRKDFDRSGHGSSLIMKFEPRLQEDGSSPDHAGRDGDLSPITVGDDHRDTVSEEEDRQPRDEELEHLPD